MKKNSLFKGGKYIFSGVFIFCLSVSFCACSLYSNMEVPEKVSVKTDAKFSVAIGEKSVDMNDIFGDSLQESISDEKLEVFKYVPDKNDDTLQYLLHSNIYNFDLDIGEMIGNLNMDDMLSGEEGIKTNEKIKIPEVKSPEPMGWDDNPVKGTASPINDSKKWKINTSISFDDVKYIKTAIVKNNASIEIKVAKPAGTTGVTLELESLTISGAGLNFTKDEFKDVTDSNYLLFKRLSFAELGEGKRTLDFSKGDIKINGIINVKIAAGAKCSGLSTKIEVDMKEIEKATADFSDLVKFKNSDSKFPENMLKCVGNVTFGEDGTHYKHEAEGKTTEIKSEGVGIKCEIVNSLPEGNDIDITIISQAFNITEVDSKDWKIHSQGNENPKTENWCVFDPIDFSDKTKFDPKNPPSMDFEIKLSDNQELKNLEFGKEYSFSIENPEFVFDWDSAEVKLGALSEEIHDENDLSSFSKETLFGDLDGEIGEFIKENIEFGDDIKAYFYAQKPDSNSGLDIGEIKLNGTVKMIYTLDGEPRDDDILKEGFGLSAPIKWKSNEKKEFTTDLKKTDFIAEYDMAKILKSGVENQKLKYDLKISGDSETTVYKLALDNLEEGASTSISIDAAIVFPLELKIKKGAKLDVLKSADFDEDKKDLFGRESGSNEDYADYLDYISFKYNLKNNVIKGFDFKIEIDDRHTGSEGQEYSGIYEIVDKDEIKFSTSDAKKILSKLFMPKIYLKFDEEKDTDITISRSGLAGENSFSFSPVVAIKLNGDSPICISDILD